MQCFLLSSLENLFFQWLGLLHFISQTLHGLAVRSQDPHHRVKYAAIWTDAHVQLGVVASCVDDLQSNSATTPLHTGWPRRTGTNTYNAAISREWIVCVRSSCYYVLIPQSAASLNTMRRRRNGLEASCEPCRQRMFPSNEALR